jgi:hypothetical protein
MPDTQVAVREVFGIDSAMVVPGFSTPDRARARSGPGLPLRP